MASGSTGRIDHAERRRRAEAGEPFPIGFFGWIRLVARSLALLLAIAVFVPLHYFYRIFAYGSPFPRMFLWLAARICGARVRRTGTPLRKNVFFVSNHISWIDILVLAGASGTAFVAKAELSRVPVIGWLCSLNRTVFVQREARMDVAGQINALREALEDNWSVTVFPEGTTTDGQSLLPFKTSMLKVLEPPPPGVLVQPVLLDYGKDGEEIGWVGEESGLANAKRILSRRGTFTVGAQFLEPFSPEDFKGRKGIASRAREQIEGALQAALGRPLREYRHEVAPVRYVPKPTEGDPPLDS